ncbi:hypothetical protein Q3O87_25180, partial [Ralstonia pseudosolanacearum]|nr:hypothetical protein [Ralstonia pseudosolanacearum]MDO3589360.1 hypothetical protein [Ralstonia pseudosolanacearum]
QRYRHVVARKRQHGLTTTLIYATTPRKGRRQWPKGEHHPKAKLRASEVLAIREDPRPPRLICAQYGIGRTTLYQIKRRETWGCLA